ncbi:helix-turn-helix domain-containing protein [Actinokineospora enzanensis]|uniref:helix-turn-helix domain-containing protein n=1 Tax=Actinokineospora enzanensis TaxID=155975 RepID=UPI00039AD2F7|nr:helix-turn-helix transcriptional regulator [Actinokineospora enzanensis]
MTDDVDPVIARLQCGELTRQLREAAGIEPGVADREMGGYASKLSKIESGTIAPQPADIEWMIKRYRPTAAQAAELTRLAVDGRRRARPAKTDVQSRQYVALERRASEIRMVYNEIPGLLQITPYAHAALSRSPVVAAADVLDIAEERAERGRLVIRPDGPDVWVVLGIEALERSSAAPGVLRQQLEHIRSIAELPNVRCRVIPREVGNVPALSAGFTLLHVEPTWSIVFVAGLTRADYIKATGPYMAAFDQAWNLASPEEETAAILEARITDLDDR